MCVGLCLNATIGFKPCLHPNYSVCTEGKSGLVYRSVCVCKLHSVFLLGRVPVCGSSTFPVNSAWANFSAAISCCDGAYVSSTF